MYNYVDIIPKYTNIFVTEIQNTKKYRYFNLNAHVWMSTSLMMQSAASFAVPSSAGKCTSTCTTPLLSASRTSCNTHKNVDNVARAQSTAAYPLHMLCYLRFSAGDYDRRTMPAQSEAWNRCKRIGSTLHGGTKHISEKTCRSHCMSHIIPAVSKSDKPSHHLISQHDIARQILSDTKCRAHVLEVANADFWRTFSATTEVCLCRAMELESLCWGLVGVGLTTIGKGSLIFGYQPSHDAPDVEGPDNTDPARHGKTNSNHSNWIFNILIGLKRSWSKQKL